MNQTEINESEWSKPDNWSGWIYFSKKDSRLWVPKRTRMMGWTINLGHSKGTAWLVGAFLLVVLFMAASNILVVNLIKQ